MSLLSSKISGLVTNGFNTLLYFSPWKAPLDSLDLSEKVALQGSHYIAIGEHADIWEGKYSDKKVAVKVLRGGSSSNPAFLQKFTRRLQREAHVWKKLEHPNISGFYGLAYNFGYMPALILPFYGHGDVVEFSKEKSNDVKLEMVKQIARGLHYLHTESVIHGDLRGANVLIDDDNQARICDFGLAFIIEPSEFTSIKTAGSCRWTSPEIMSPPEEEDVEDQDEPVALFTAQSDIYAFGMTVLEIFTGAIPFSKKKNDSSVIFFVLDGGRPELPPYLKAEKSFGELVQSCWAEKPDKRPTSWAVLERLDPSVVEIGAVSDVEAPRRGWFSNWSSN